MGKCDPSLRDRGLPWPFISSLIRLGVEVIKFGEPRTEPERLNYSTLFVIRVIA